MLRVALKKIRDFIAPQKADISGECFVTIYSKKMSVVSQIIDHYLSDAKPLKKLHAARVAGEHQLFLSESLLQATERLIGLQKAGKVAATDGAACHLVATVNMEYLSQLLRKSKEFRLYLRDLEANPKQAVNF